MLLRASVLASAVLTAFLFLASYPSARIGDGAEYACMAENWARHGTPWMSTEFQARCAGAVPGFVNRDGTWDAVHFWFVSMLAAPFWFLSRDAGVAFTMLHAAITSSAVVYWARSIGTLAATVVATLFLASPLMWWTNKAHGEIFVCLTLLLAFTDIARKRWLFSALWFAAASTQQSTLAIFGGAALCIGLIQSRFRRKSRSEVTSAVAAAGLLALAPSYTLIRYGHPSLFLLIDTVDSALISFHRAASLYVDPDIGLLVHWPVAFLAAPALFFAPRGLAIASAIYLCVEPVLLSSQRNWNSGGTVHISRYALYLMPPMIACAAGALMRIPPRWQKLGGAVAVCVILSAATSWTWPLFRPDTPESYLSHTAQADRLYREHPAWYDPVPEVFVERSIYREIAVAPPEVWAIGVPSCSKLLVLPAFAELARQGGQKPASPPGCLLPNDADSVFRDIVAGKIKPNSRGYVNIP